MSFSLQILLLFLFAIQKVRWLGSVIYQEGELSLTAVCCLFHSKQWCVILPLGDIWQSLQTSFDTTTNDRSAVTVLAAEARNPAKYRAMGRAASHDGIIQLEMSIV